MTRGKGAVRQETMQRRIGFGRDVRAEALRTKNIFSEAVIVFILLHFLGFPGNYTNVFGEMLETVIDYAAFLLQIVVMLVTSSDSVKEIRLFSFQKRYLCLYLFEFAIIALSMLTARHKSEEMITCVRLYVLVTFSIWMTRQYSVEQLVEFLCRAQMFFLFFTLVLTVLFPRYAFSSEVNENDFVGLITTKNSSATELAFGILMHLVLYRIRKKKNRPAGMYIPAMLALQGALMLMCRATGALLSLILVAVYLFVLQGRGDRTKRLPLGFLYVIASIGFLFAALSILPLFEPLLNALGKDATLTGRVPIWNQLIKVMTQGRTLTGYGYEMFWRDEEAVRLFHIGFDRNSWARQMTTGSHNVMMEMWLNTGLIGVSLFLFLFLDAFRSTASMEEDQYLYCGAVVLLFMIFGFTERSMGQRDYMTMNLFMAMAIGCSANEMAAVRQEERRMERIRQRRALEK